MKSITSRRAVALVVMVSVLAVAVALRGNTRKRGMIAASAALVPAAPAKVRDPDVTFRSAALPAMPSLFVQTASREGIAVEFSIQHVDPSKAGARNCKRATTLGYDSRSPTLQVPGHCAVSTPRHGWISSPRRISASPIPANKRSRRSLAAAFSGEPNWT